MKKLFTFFAAMALVTMSFAQGLVMNTNTQVQLPEQSRTGWSGFYATSGGVFVLTAGSEYVLRIPAGEAINGITINPGDTITKVRFYHTTSDHVDGYDGTFNNETYRISIYTNNIVYDADNGNVTFDPTPAYRFNYTVPEGDDGLGINVADLPVPFIVPAGTGDIVIGIYGEDIFAGCLCPEDTTCVDKSFMYYTDAAGNGYHHYVFAAHGSEDYLDQPFLLSAYVQNGEQAHPMSDLHTKIYDPEDAQPYPDAVESFTVDQYTDSVYFYGGAFNSGPEPSVGYYTLSIYLDGSTPYYFQEPEQLYDEPDTVNMHYGWRWQFGLFDIVEDMPDLREMGFDFPLQLCLSLTYTSTAAYSGYDPNTDNDTYCVTIEMENGINETTNTLNVYPNPACNVINVDNAAGAQISIYNIAGQEVMAIEAANANETINVSNLTEGVYVVRVVNGNEVATSKVSIVR